MHSGKMRYSPKFLTAPERKLMISQKKTLKSIFVFWLQPEELKSPLL